MQIFETTYLDAGQRDAVFELWNSECPVKLQYQSVAQFDTYLNALTDGHHYLLCTVGGSVLGWAFAFLRDGERWFAILLHNECQRKGWGTALLNKLKENEPELNGWVVDHDRYFKQNGAVYHSPLQFYCMNDFKLCPEIRLEIEVLSAAKISWKK